METTGEGLCLPGVFILPAILIPILITGCSKYSQARKMFNFAKFVC